MFRLLFCEERDYYYKLYYYTTTVRKTRMFMFPKSGQMDFYTMMCMSPQFPNEVLQILHEIKLLDKDSCQWCSGETLSNMVSDSTVVQCEKKLQELIRSMDQGATCQVCREENQWRSIVSNRENHLMPICRGCKSLLLT